MVARELVTEIIGSLTKESMRQQVVWQLVIGKLDMLAAASVRYLWRRQHPSQPADPQVSVPRLCSPRHARLRQRRLSHLLWSTCR
jgi:hypothetical protein